jgi:hypothetical protein
MSDLPHRTKMPEYRTYIDMIWRCSKPTCKSYKNYGGRGIVVCDRWLLSFDNFLSDMGPRPSSKHSIDRYPNNDGNYEPSNCRWATMVQQINNRRARPNVGITMRRGKFVARVWHENKGIYLGQFASEQEALGARKAALDQLKAAYR